ncbi:hypothetical protein IM538_13720 [Cytobacillus suaedae]|nr:hypothetical protein IM538_13720 [Cytobacillus suaedae]
MKLKLVKVVLALFLLLSALFINPKELYYNFRAEKEVVAVAHFLGIVSEQETIDDINEYGIEIKYLGGNVYQFITESENLLIKKNREGSSDLYEVYSFEQGFQVFDGLK